MRSMGCYGIKLVETERSIYESVNKTIIDSYYGSLPVCCQDIILTNAELSLIRTFGTNLSEIWSRIKYFLYNEINLEMWSAKWEPFCLSLDVFTPLPWAVRTFPHLVRLCLCQARAKLVIWPGYVGHHGYLCGSAKTMWPICASTRAIDLLQYSADLKSNLGACLEQYTREVSCVALTLYNKSAYR